MRELKQRRAEHWTAQIEKMILDSEYRFAHDYLNNVLQGVKQFNNITDGQIEAVKNIKYRRNA